jgi:predicted PurR-regulated permease PerM
MDHRPVAPEASEAGPASPPVSATETLPARAATSGPALQVLVVLAVIVVLWWGREFIVPVLTATFLAYTLKPIVERLHRWHVPRSVGAALVLGCLCGGLVYGAASLRDEALTTLQELPAAARRFSHALTGLYHRPGSTVRTVEEVAREIERATRPARELSNDPHAPASPPVVIAAPASSLNALVWSGSLTALSAIGTVATSLLLMFFLLQTGDSFRRKIVRVFGPSLSTRRATVEVLNDINAQIQRYMFMLLVTNTVLALASWGVYALIGLDNAALWAIAAAVLHVIPYLGAILSILVTSIAAFTQFESFAMTLLVAGATLGLATLVGMGLAPWMSGRQARMNPTAIFLALLFFGWLWGALGLLLAIPIIAICKVVADRVDRFHAVAELLGE